MSERSNNFIFTCKWRVTYIACCFPLYATTFIFILCLYEVKHCAIHVHYMSPCIMHPVASGERERKREREREMRRKHFCRVSFSLRLLLLLLLLLSLASSSSSSSSLRRWEMWRVKASMAEWWVSGLCLMHLLSLSIPHVEWTPLCASSVSARTRRGKLKRNPAHCIRLSFLFRYFQVNSMLTQYSVGPTWSGRFNHQHGRTGGGPRFNEIWR